jgi:ABC-2 type transport system ATP-binding protein
MENQFPIIQFHEVSKRFGSTIALRNIDLSIQSGSIIGLVGANGCGKSTLIRNIVGLYLPDDGRVTTIGVEAKKLGPDQLARIGYVHQEGQLLDWMSVQQQIEYVAAYYDHWNLDLQSNYIERFDIDLNSKVGKLSPGQRQQLAILLAICHEPELLILDEPASALDPLARGEFFNLLLELIQTNEDRTILISSHILSDIEKVVDRLIVMKSGQIIVDRPLDELQEAFCRVTLTGMTDDQRPALDHNRVISAKYAANGAVLLLHGIDPGEIRSQADSNGWLCRVDRLSIDEIYKMTIALAEKAA